MQDPEHGATIRRQVMVHLKPAEGSLGEQATSKPLTSTQLHQLLGMIRATDALSYTQRKAQELAQSALEWLPTAVNVAVREQLVEIVDLVIYRQL